MRPPNLILLTDSYKLSHACQYPPGTEGVYSYFESRRGTWHSEAVFFGLQYFLKKYLRGAVVSRDDITEAYGVSLSHFGHDLFNLKGWEYIVREHGGRLPVRIRAVPEGSVVPKSNVLMTIENTDPKCYWLTNYLETLLVQVWYPCTVATISREVRKTILASLEATGCDPKKADFMLHDFGFRGSTSVESAGIGGLAHLLNFKGTDTLAAITTGMEFYNSGVCGFSIPASEHSTITSWGKGREVDAFRNMLTTYPTGLVACVSDSYDIQKACSELWGKELREEVLARDGTLVIRPDSGELPATVLDVLRRLDRAFGGTTLNAAGFKVLNPKIRVIQGDGCSPAMIRDILHAMKVQGWAAENIAFGMGGGLLQQLDRDTLSFAFKCSAINVDGWRDVWKESPGKSSKRGRLKLVCDERGFRTIQEAEEPSEMDYLETVFENGQIVREHTFQEIRERLETPSSRADRPVSRLT